MRLTILLVMLLACTQIGCNAQSRQQQQQQSGGSMIQWKPDWEILKTDPGQWSSSMKSQAIVAMVFAGGAYYAKMGPPVIGAAAALGYGLSGLTSMYYVVMAIAAWAFKIKTPSYWNCWMVWILPLPGLESHTILGVPVKGVLFPNDVKVQHGGYVGNWATGASHDISVLWRGPKCGSNSPQPRDHFYYATTAHEMEHCFGLYKTARLKDVQLITLKVFDKDIHAIAIYHGDHGYILPRYATHHWRYIEPVHTWVWYGSLRTRKMKSNLF